VRENGNIFCEPNPCLNTNRVWFQGACTFIFNASACPSVGERLFVDKHGDAICDCDDGWARGPGGKCFQEFTRGFCQEDTILRIKKKRCQAQTLDLDFQECIFPFIHNNTVYTGCAQKDWPQQLSEEVENHPWCPTALTPDKTLLEFNWGLCDDTCPLDKHETAVLYKDELRLLVTNSTNNLECIDNPCGDPRISLPHITTWNETNIVCHNVTFKDEMCEIYVNEETNLECCDARNTLKCEQAHIKGLTTFKVVSSCNGKKSCRCSAGYTWSEFRDMCIPLFRGAPPRKHIDETVRVKTGEEGSDEIIDEGSTTKDADTITTEDTFAEDDTTTTQSLDVK